MKMTQHSGIDRDTPEIAAGTSDADAEIRARRAVVKRMLTVAAAAPMAALLFDPRKARADGTGVLGQADGIRKTTDVG
jgi:hypothetical protein